MYPVAGDPYAQWLAQKGAAAVGPVSGMAGVFRDWVSQPRDFSMEAMLSGPRGPLVDAVKSMPALNQAALATAPVPIVGDLVGLAADARMYATEPESRTLGNAGLSMLGLLPFVPGMTAFHGTPHRFAPEPDAPLGKFRLDKIGTGEGAQAYGHGIYLAESPDVAKNYAPRDFDYEDKLMALYKRAEAAEDYDAMEAYEAAMLHAGPSEIAEAMGGRAPAAQKQIADLYENMKGTLYEVDLPDEQIAKMLDWDKPLSEQPESVRKAVSEIFPERDRLRQEYLTSFKSDEARSLASKMLDAPEKDVVGDSARMDWWRRLLELEPDLDHNAIHDFHDWSPNPGISPPVKNWTGADVYENLARQPHMLPGFKVGMKSEAAASEFLNRLGVPGVRYLDGNSRAAGDGTRNFVLFNPEIAKIVDRK